MMPWTSFGVVLFPNVPESARTRAALPVVMPTGVLKAAAVTGTEVVTDAVLMSGSPLRAA